MVESGGYFPLSTNLLIETMIQTILKRITLATALLPIALALPTPAQAAITNSCTIKPGPSSPLAMRANFTLEEQDGKTVIAKYNASPSPVNAGQPTVIYNSIQLLSFNETNIPAVRALMLKDPQYFKLLTQFPEETSFKLFNDALTCTSSPKETPKEIPKETPQTSIDQLPDGDYRFWNKASANNVTDQQILETGEGGGLFLFKKTGNTVIGTYARPNDVAYCITGSLAGGKVTGKASPIDRNLKRPADNSSYDPIGRLKFGTWKGPDKSGFSEGTVLDVSSFSRINLGARKAHANCR
jgi:hypothetical protein